MPATYLTVAMDEQKWITHRPRWQLDVINTIARALLDAKVVMILRSQKQVDPCTAYQIEQERRIVEKLWDEFSHVAAIISRSRLPSPSDT